MSRQTEREYDQLDRDLMNGLISNVEYNKQIRDLQRFEREEMFERAEQAYRDVIERW